jgi:beta-galactosidase
MKRRNFFAGATALGAARAFGAQLETGAPAQVTESLNGEWRFQLEGAPAWRVVRVPHTWQVEDGSEAYYGAAWYERDFDVPESWRGSAARVEFEAVFHSAEVWVNGAKAGEHLRKGYTAFALDVTALLQYGAPNSVRVRVTNAFDDAMLPRGRSSDWAHDGGLYRPVWLHVTPKTYIERVEIDADPDLASGRGTVEARLIVANAAGALRARWRIVEEETGRVAGSGESGAVIRAAIERVRLWHFDQPHLYRLEVALDSGHRFAETFGFRRIEIRDRAFWVNGERVRLMGVERMAGSNPDYGMAEPTLWIEHDHADMKELNCVFTRVHWPQDRRVLDYCDRHGIFLQTEVPTWGPATFAGMKDEPAPALMENGLEQLREMIARDRNHPCLFSWGVCNEVGGQNPPAYRFAKRLYDEAKRLDPRRPATYASHSLRATPEKDVSREMDFVSWNEYYGSWYPGTPETLGKNLDEIGRAFPDKPIVISEYGYCACTADRPEGDTRRIEILREHSRVARERPFVAGLIFFDYNDYRTHVGDKGLGALKQRVHGVVDVYGGRKASWRALQDEASPILALSAHGLKPGEMTVTLEVRNSVPAYRLRGYVLEAVIYGFGEIPLERKRVRLRELAPGETETLRLSFQEKAALRVTFEVRRPTEFPAKTLIWTA